MSEKILTADSKERVALELAVLIARPLNEPNRDENDWLNLYARCLHAVQGRSVETAPPPR